MGRGSETSVKRANTQAVNAIDKCGGTNGSIGSSTDIVRTDVDTHKNGKRNKRTLAPVSEGTFQIRMSDDLKARAQEAARKETRSLANWITWLMERELACKAFVQDLAAK